MASHDELTTQECYSIINQASDLKIFSISFAGAEPTMRNDLCELLSQCKEKHIYTALATNGYNLSPNYLQDLICSGLGEVAISVDSHSQDINDRHRGLGTQSKILNAIKLLRNSSLKFSLSISIGNDNYFDLVSTIEFFSNLSITKFRLQFITEYLYNSQPSIQLSQSKIFEVARKLSKHQFADDIDISFGCSTGYLNYIFLRKKPLDNLGTCSVGTNLLTINSDGKITTCIHGLLPEEIVGDLRSQTLKSLLDIPDSNITKWINKGDTSKIKDEKCCSCSILNLCKGGCKAMVFSKNNSFNFSDNNCLGNE